MEEEVPGCGTARAWCECCIHVADRAEGVVAEAFDDIGACVDDSGRIQVVFENEADLSPALPADHGPTVERAPDILCSYAATDALLNGTPLLIVVVIDAPSRVGLAGVAGAGVVLIGDFSSRGGGGGTRRVVATG